MSRRTLLAPLLAVAVCAATAAMAMAAPQRAPSGPSTPPPGGRQPSSPGQRPNSTPGAQPPAAAPPGAVPAGEARFYERMDAEDRAALDANVGYLMPAPVGKLEWVGGDALMSADFRGTVTVIQSIGGKANGRTMLDKLRKLLPENVRLIGLHTPENADRAQTVYGTNPPCLIAIDRTGEWCDALGVWKRPVNIVIDKTGGVRYVGLSEVGLKNKLEALLAETVDDSVVAKPRPNAPKNDETGAKPVAWPVFNHQIQGAADMRGKALPQFVVQKWHTRQPDPRGRLIVLDFWATWCGPCRQAIPHLNELQNRHGDTVLVVGVSSETPRNFEQGLQKANLKDNDFHYSLALDPGARMAKFLGVTAVPHIAILSPDLTVRWQGHPSQLSATDVQSLVDAHKALGAAAPVKPGNTRGWTKGTSSVGY